MAVNVTTDQTFEQDTATGVTLTDFWASRYLGADL